ncbi:MAG: hypothetical protein Kow0059_05990 [Candidatus Sumerlaeia bacterium]
MASGRDISVAFIREVLWPLLECRLDRDAERLAVAVIGTGSDVAGLDDDISRDHHWGPRANVMTLPEDGARLKPRISEILERELPPTFRGFPVARGVRIMTGVCTTDLDEFFGYFLGTAALPQRDVEWLALCETDLRHVTGGVVVIDGPGELTRRREHLAYYPDPVWRKRVADWCMYLTGRDAPYNLHRVSRRGDGLTGAIYKALYLKQAMELTFTLNRRYAPYTKWLNRLFRSLPRFAERIAPLVDAIHGESDHRRNVFQMIELNYVFAEAVADLGLARRPQRVPFDEGLTDLTLYDTAAQIYAGLPADLLAPSFNRTELWERLARDVLFDTNDYFVQRGRPDFPCSRPGEPPQ